MCFIVAVVSLVLAFNFYNAGSIMLAVGSVSVSIFFIFLMIRNIQHVKKLKESRKNDN